MESLDFLQGAATIGGKNTMKYAIGIIVVVLILVIVSTSMNRQEKKWVGQLAAQKKVTTTPPLRAVTTPFRNPGKTYKVPYVQNKDLGQGVWPATDTNPWPPKPILVDKSEQNPLNYSYVFNPVTNKYDVPTSWYPMNSDMTSGAVPDGLMMAPAHAWNKNPYGLNDDGTPKQPVRTDDQIAVLAKYAREIAAARARASVNAAIDGDAELIAAGTKTVAGTANSIGLLISAKQAMVAPYLATVQLYTKVNPNGITVYEDNNGVDMTAEVNAAALAAEQTLAEIAGLQASLASGMISGEYTSAANSGPATEAMRSLRRQTVRHKEHDVHTGAAVAQHWSGAAGATQNFDSQLPNKPLSLSNVVHTTDEDAENEDTYMELKRVGFAGVPSYENLIAARRNSRK